MRIDLHMHTTASDGLLAPAALLAKARAAGLDVIAITDHDTAAGVREARRGPIPEGLEVVAGIEVSSFVGERDLHILGYFIDPDAACLVSFEEERRRLRTERLARIVDRLRASGLAITIEEVRAQPGGDGAPGRPHVARTLVAKGYAKTMSEVFTTILGRDGPGHVPVEKPAPREAAALIREAGGVPVIAHAALDGVEETLDELVAAGLQGIEVYHPDHKDAHRARYLAYAEAHGLSVTGGSDFHGEGRKDGGALGGTMCPEAAFRSLRARAMR